jgi:hypothetical protein
MFLKDKTPGLHGAGQGFQRLFHSLEKIPQLAVYVLRRCDGTNGRAQAHHPLVRMNCGDQLVKGTHRNFLKKHRPRKQKTPRKLPGLCGLRQGA